MPPPKERINCALKGESVVELVSPHRLPALATPPPLLNWV